MFHVLLLRARDAYEPELSDGYESSDERDAMAREIWAEADADDDLIYRVDTNAGGGVGILPYGNEELRHP